jgi:hypothetical protein
MDIYNDYWKRKESATVHESKIKPYFQKLKDLMVVKVSSPQF